MLSLEDASPVLTIWGPSMHRAVEVGTESSNREGSSNDQVEPLGPDI
jgi:hypothetical protein